MSETFGYRLKQFALAKDIVDEETFKEVFEMIRHYVDRHMELAYWALLVEAVVNGKPGLQAYKSSTGSTRSFSIKTPDDLYAGLAPYAFANVRKLWIVSSDREPLDQDKRLVDLWSDTRTEDLPAYHRSRGVTIRTAILAPLELKGRKLGVLDLQMSEYYECTKIAIEELEHLVNILSELMVLSEINQMHRDYTQRALRTFQTILERESCPLTKPQIFVASSSRADSAVMGKIMSVLNDFADSLRIYDWAHSPNSGNINLEVLKQVKASRFGLCYFSEPANDPGVFKYQDNANVIFEAGMFQSLTNPAVTDDPTGWIPVRESSSPPLPFNFAQQRMIIVERLQDDRPNLNQLRADLTRRIETLLT